MRLAAVLAAAHALFAAVPLRFEESRGGYLARANGFTALLTSRGVVLSAGEIRFDGANPTPVLRGLDPLPGRSHYLVGSDPSRWRTGIRQYGRVRYEALYPGIDAVFYGNARQRLEYDFIVAPGADPGLIRLVATGLRPVASGALAAYQGGRKIACRYRMVPGGTLSFELGPYDRTRPLVIDPELNYSTFLGGAGGSVGESIAIDAQGYIYITGTTTSNNFPLAEPLQPYFYGSNEVFVTKLDPTGTTLLYSTYLGSWGDDKATDIAVDAEGCAYVTGYTTSPDFPTAGPLRAGHRGGSLANGGDAFIFKLSQDGSELVWSRLFGGTGDDIARSIALDAAGNIWIAGSTGSIDLPLEKPLQEFHGGATRDIFAAKFDPSGERLLFSTYWGGARVDEGNAIALDPEGNAYITGTTAQPTAEFPFDFPLKNPIREAYGGGTRDAVVVKFKADGSEAVYSTIIGGTGDDTSRSIAVDSGGHAYITGYTTSSSYPTTPNRFKGFATSREVFITKLNPEGNAIAYSTFLGGNSNDEAFSIALDSDGNMVVAGFAQSTNFPVKEAIQPAVAGNCTRTPCTAELFISKLNAAGSALVYSTYLGGTGADQPRAVAIDPEGRAVVTGYTASRDFPIAGGLQDVHNGGGTNIAFIVRLKE